MTYKTFLKYFLLLIIAILIFSYMFAYQNAHSIRFSTFEIISVKPITEREIFTTKQKPIENMDEILSWENLHEKSWSKNIFNGHWKPTNSSSNQSLAIIVPFRNRDDHLKKFLEYLHPFLQRQNTEYQIFVIEQSKEGIFNKGSLMNVGFTVAENSNHTFTCFIFHDVDMLPIKKENIYKCADHPLHLGAAVDKFGYKLVYEGIVGGVLAMTSEQFYRVNGFSNIYEGWGGEDDDMTIRIKEENYSIMRYPIFVGQYKMFKHDLDTGNPKNKDRVILLVNAKKRYKFDGLKQLSYKSLKTDNSKSILVCWIKVELFNKSYFMKKEPISSMLKKDLVV